MTAAPQIIKIDNVTVDNNPIVFLTRLQRFALRLIGVKPAKLFSIEITCTAEDPYMIRNDLFMIAAAGEEYVFFVTEAVNDLKTKCAIKAASVKAHEYPLMFIPDGIVVFAQAASENATKPLFI